MNSEASDSLIGHWSLERLRTADALLAPPVDGTRVEVHFEADGGVGGTGGCNSFRGSYRTDAGSITIEPPATTRRFCLRPPGVMEQESRFLDSIVAATRFSIDETGKLSLYDAAGDALAVMSRSVETHAP